MSAADLLALSPPDLIVLVLTLGLPLGLALLAWPLLRQRRPKMAEAAVTPLPNGRAALLWHGQWAARERQIRAGIADQCAVVGLHRLAGLRLGALDYEIDRLGREVRALGLAEETAACRINGATPLPKATPIEPEQPADRWLLLRRQHLKLAS